MKNNFSITMAFLNTVSALTSVTSATYQFKHCSIAQTTNLSHEKRSSQADTTACSTCLFVVLQLRYVSAAGLRNSLPGHQVSHYHGRRADLCSITDTSAAVRRRHTCTDVRAFGAFGPAHCGWRDGLTWLLLSGLWQIGDARVGAHQDVAGVQGAFQEALLGLRYVDAAQRCFGKRVGRHQSQTVHAHLVDAVYGLKQ